MPEFTIKRTKKREALKTENLSIFCNLTSSISFFSIRSTK